MSEVFDDPFAPEADPYWGQDWKAPRISRRVFGGLLLGLPAVAACPGCAVKRPVLGCEPASQVSPYSCRHRFCRYFEPDK